eukprot:scaffold23502_cov161-Skeletonema_dohrnii-CCMP3373.AAC.9
MVEVHIVTCHCETHKIARHELWYTESDYHRMRLAEERRKRKALLRAQRSSISKLHQKPTELSW